MELLASKSPSFARWRRTNDAGMVPDKGFMKQLKCLDPTFEVVWDWGAEKWEIWSFPKEGQDPYHIMTVQANGRTYRELGTDVLLQMQQSVFMSNNMTTKQICDYLDEMDTQVQRRQAKDLRNKLAAIAGETFLRCAGIVQLQVPRSYKVERVVANG